MQNLSLRVFLALTGISLLLLPTVLPKVALSQTPASPYLSLIRLVVTQGRGDDLQGKAIGFATTKDDWFMHPFLYSASKMQQLETLGSGIEGQVTVGPISPVERPGMVNEHPYQATIIVLDKAGQIVTQFQSDVDGHFRVRLKPGTYTLRPESPATLPYAKEETVTVCKMKFTQVQISYDSGIR